MQNMIEASNSSSSEDIPIARPELMAECDYNLNIETFEPACAPNQSGVTRTVIA